MPTNLNIVIQIIDCIWAADSIEQGMMIIWTETSMTKCHEL